MTHKKILVDDLDGSQPARPVTFSLDGRRGSVDLSPVNINRLRTFLEPYFQAGRSRSTRVMANSAEIRQWGKENGLLEPTSPNTGRIPSRVIQAWHDHQCEQIGCS